MIAGMWKQMTRRFTLWAALAAVAGGLLGAAGCSSGDDRGGEDVGDQLDGGPTVDAGDVQVDGDGSATDPIEPEDYAISYLLKNKAQGTRKLMVYKTGEATTTQVSPDGQSCQYGCWLTRDMATFVWAEQRADEPGNQVRYEVHSAPVNNLQVQGTTGDVLVDSAASVDVMGNVVTYSVDEGGHLAARYKPAAGGDAVTIGPLGTNSTSIGDWFVAPEADRAMIYDYTPQTLNLKFGAVGELLDDTSYTVSAKNYQVSSGSYFGRGMPVAISPDGSTAAFVTQAPNDYGACTDASDCSGPVQKCGRQKRCTAIELTAQFIDLEHIDELGQPCRGKDSCDGVDHTCYEPTDDAANSECVPKRVVLGMPKTPEQSASPGEPSQTGCELTDGNADYHYTALKGPITFDDEGHLYGAATRDCAEGDGVGDSDIIEIDPAAGSYEVVWGNPDTGYDPNSCWNADKQVPDDQQCVPYVSAVRVSPDDNELAFLATTPYVSSPALATDSADLWTVLRNGEGQKWVGQSETAQKSIAEFHVHPLP